MRMYTALKNILTIVKWLYESLTDSSTLPNRYVIFPNGLKICWGHFSNQKYGGTVELPLSFQDGYAIILPEYSYAESWRVHYNCSRGAYQGKLKLYPYDTQTHDSSTSTKLSGIFIIIGQ